MELKKAQINTELETLRFLLIERYKEAYPNIENKITGSVLTSIYNDFYNDIDRKLGEIVIDINKNPKKNRNKYLHHCVYFQNYIFYSDNKRKIYWADGKKERFIEIKETRKFRKPTKEEVKRWCIPDKESFRRFISGETKSSIAEHAKDSYLLHLGKTKSDLVKLTIKERSKTQKVNGIPKEIDSKKKFDTNEVVTNNKKSRNEKLLPYWLRYTSVIIFVLVAVYSAIKPILDKNEPIKKNRWETNIIHKKHNPKNVFSNDSTSFKLLVLPFEDNESDSLSRLEKKFLHRFEEIKLKDSLNIEVKYINNRKITPFHSNQAENIVEEYQADMVIWGDFIKKNTINKDEINIKFSLSSNAYMLYDFFNPKKKKQTTETNYKETRLSLLRIGHLQKDIDQVIYRIMGIKSFLNREYDNTLYLYKELINKSEVTDKFIVGITFEQLGDFTTSLSMYNEIIKIDSLNYFAWDSKGFILAKMEKYKKALNAYNKAISLNSKSSFIFHNRGVLFGKMGNLKKALDNFNIAIELNPNDDFYWFSKGLTLHKLDDRFNALKAYNKSIKLNPNNIDSWYFRGILLQYKGNKDKILEHHNKATILNPNSIKLLFSKAAFLYDIGELNKSLEIYNKIIKLEPNKIEALNNKGIVLFKLGNNKKALKIFNQVLELNNKFYKSLNNKSIVLYKMDKKKEAISILKKIIELKPEVLNDLEDMKFKFSYLMLTDINRKINYIDLMILAED